MNDLCLSFPQALEVQNTKIDKENTAQGNASSTV